MKRLLTILILISATATSLQAQNFSRRGFSLGADRDTLLYIIASPFDNWYINVGGGVQTFMGNELIAFARHNKLNFYIQSEIGKWIIPDVAVSARLSFFNVDGQSRYGLQPFVDYLNDTPNENGYFPFHAYALSLMGYVTLDWTNFLSGYEIGKRTKTHIFTPVGLGASVLMGAQRNPRGEPLGSFRRNFELSYSAGLGAEYEVTQEFALSATIELYGSESTWDWSPYDNSYSRFDIIPSFNVRARFNLLRNVTKYNPYTKRSSREKVNHEFISFGTRNTIPNLTGRSERLSHNIDSIQNLAGERGTHDSMAMASMNKELQNLQEQLDSVKALPHSPANMIEELLQMNEEWGLPATIVYFQLDRYELDYNGRKKLQNFAKIMNNLDDTVEFYIIGSADSITGTPRHNQWLSERRCEAAYNMLVDHFGANANQLILVPVGGIMEYEPQENNRMAMVILRSPATEEIINRWMRKRK